MMMTLRYSRWDQKRREPLVRSSPSCITTNRHAFACPLALGPSLSLNLCARSSVAKNNRVIIRVPCCDILGTGTHQNKNELKPHNFFQVVLPCLPRNLNNCIWWFDLARATRLHSSLSLSFFFLSFFKTWWNHYFLQREFWWLQAVRNTWWLIRKLLDAARCYTPFSSPLCAVFSLLHGGLYTRPLFSFPSSGSSD